MGKAHPRGAQIKRVGQRPIPVILAARQGVCNFEINDFVEIVQKNSEETALFALQNLEISAFFIFQNLEETALFTYNFSEGM